MPVRTKRWDDPIEPEDGVCILITRYRPRGLPRSAETWSVWMPELGPSVELHAAAYGKGRAPLDWEAYRLRYLREMLAQKPLIAAIAARVARGETITLLCSSQCIRESRCHRSLLAGLIDRAIADGGPGG